jgi:hypothetical protein
MFRDQSEVPPVTPRSRRDIESRTDRLLQTYYPEHWSTPRPVPVLHLFEFILPKRYRIQTSVQERLPYGVEGVAYPRNANGYPEIVLLERVYERADDGFGRDRFTAAHECGHGLMHLTQINTQLVDGRVPAMFRRQDIRPYLDPEWQAHVFAGAFLMPTAAVQAFVKSSGADPVLMAGTFQVSTIAAEKRLTHMRKGGQIP